MTVIEIPDEQAAVLKARAAAEGLSLEAWVASLADAAASRKPKSAFGLLAQYGPGPSAEEIDENRREMFSGFGEGEE